MSRQGLTHLSKPVLGDRKPRPPEDYLDDPNGSLARNWYKATTGNPLFAWHVLAACLDREGPLPPEIKPYFTNLCREIIRVANADMEPKERRKAIMDCVIPPGRGGNNAFTQYLVTRRNEAVVAAVDELKLRYGHWSGEQTLDNIYAEVAATHDRKDVSQVKPGRVETFKKIYQKNRYDDWDIVVLGPRPRRTRKKRVWKP
jgi:hypothetical protein